MTLHIPTLRADDPLGFLAAVGLAALSEQQLLPAVRIGWVGRAAPTLAVDADLDRVDELADALDGAFHTLQERDEVVPGLGPDFPVPRPGGGRDPMRMTRPQMARWYEHADVRWHAGDPWFARWLIALAAQSAVKDDKRGDVVLTPFYGPTGQMALRTSLFDKTVEAVSQVGGPRDALTRWRRTTAFAGANFDDRAERNAGVSPKGQPENQGAPSPTWLAVMAIRLFPIVDDGINSAPVGWQRTRMYPGFTARSMVWPAWRPMLDAPAVRTLLAHPALRLAGPWNDPRVEGQEELEALGVVAVFGSSRRTLRQGDGPLGPARRLWVASTGQTRPSPRQGTAAPPHR